MPPSKPRPKNGVASPESLGVNESSWWSELMILAESGKSLIKTAKHNHGGCKNDFAKTGAEDPMTVSDRCKIEVIKNIWSAMIQTHDAQALRPASLY